MESRTLTTGPDAGGMHSAPVLGEADAMAAGCQLRLAGTNPLLCIC